MDDVKLRALRCCKTG